MMTVYEPDNWVVIKISGDDPHYRVLAGWSGGYLDGDRWRLNSGITGVTLAGDYYHFPGSSGSNYVCHKDAYGLRMNNSHIWSQLKDLHGNMVELMPEDSNWFDVDWIIDKETEDN